MLELVCSTKMCCNKLVFREEENRFASVCFCGTSLFTTNHSVSSVNPRVILLCTVLERDVPIWVLQCLHSFLYTSCISDLRPLYSFPGIKILNIIGIFFRDINKCILTITFKSFYFCISKLLNEFTTNQSFSPIERPGHD